MRVVQVTGFGGPEVLVETQAPDPVAASGQVVVDVELAEVLFLDTQLRQGWGQAFFPLRPPFVPGVGVAGTVRAVGEGVESGLVGRRVIADTGRTGEYVGGGYAERTVAAATEIFPVPDTIASADALAVLHDGFTAMSRLTRAGVRSGDRVLVTAAAGSLGAWLVPLSRAAGASVVVGAARGEAKLEQVRRLGGEAVDYSAPDWTDRVRATTGGGVDVVLDGAGGAVGEAAFQVVAAHGRFVAYGSASGTFAEIDQDDAAHRQVEVIGIHDSGGHDDRRDLTERAMAEVAAGRVRPTIGLTVPLAKAADAHAAIEARQVVGKTLLQP